MKYIDLQESFEIEVNKLDDNLTKPTSLITEYFINAGLDEFWKTRYSGYNFKREGFEQTQKRVDDLRTLVTERIFESTDIISEDNVYKVTLPEDYVILLGDTTGITPADGLQNECWDLDSTGNYKVHYSDPIEGTIETIDRIKENSLSEYHLRYTKARPIRLVSGNSINLHTDDKYKVAEYRLTYLRKPQKVNIHKTPFAEYTDMPEHTQLEIVKLAAKLYIENKSDQRYNTYSNEISTME